MKNFKKQKGFTLLEMLVVSAIFVMAMTSMVSIFVQTNRAQKRLANSEKLQADTRYVVELIAREVRTNKIDYAFYNGYPGKDMANQELSYLALRDADNRQTIFHFEENKMKICRFVSELINCSTNSFYDVTPADISVTSMKFFVTPTSDPFVIYAVDRPDNQPLVTIALTTQSLTKDLDDPKWIRYQTAISSRYYAR